MGGNPVGTEQFKTRSQFLNNQYGNLLLPEAGVKRLVQNDLKQDHNVSLISTETICYLRPAVSR